jgi:hypothetical protein
VVAFLDAHVRDSNAAQQWLASDRIVRASNGIVSLFRK